MSIRNDVGLLAVTGFILYMFWLASTAPAGSIDNSATRPYVASQIATHAGNTNLHIAAGNVYNITSTGSQDSAKLGGIAAASYLTNNHDGASFSGTTTFTNVVVNGTLTAAGIVTNAQPVISFGSLTITQLVWVSVGAGTWTNYMYFNGTGIVSTIVP